MLMSAVSEKSAGDDLDYNLTFPAAISGGEVEPVIILLGWVGSKDKILAKYSAIYEKEGCITIRYIHPVQITFLSDPSESKSHAAASVKLVQLLDDYELRDNPLFLHIFSNGGFFIYRYLAFELEKSNINVAGAIFDSCPSHLHWNIAVRAMYHSVPNRLVFFFMAIVFSLFYLYVFTKQLLGLKGKDLYETMQNCPQHKWPHLYLYSSADVLVPTKHIETMADSRIKAGVPVVNKHNFGTSAHVMHFKAFPDEYRQFCVDFVRSCLRDGHVSTDKSLNRI